MRKASSGAACASPCTRQSASGSPSRSNPWPARWAVAARLSADRSATLEGVRGNCWPGEEIGPEKPFSTIWFEMEAVRGDRVALQKAYRNFVLKHLALSPAFRQPRIFYSTWNYQERLKH